MQNSTPTYRYLEVLPCWAFNTNQIHEFEPLTAPLIQFSGYIPPNILPYLTLYFSSIVLVLTYMQPFLVCLRIHYTFII